MKDETKTAKKEPKKAKPKKYIYRGREYKCLDESEHMMKLTDGIIHFWAKKKNVTVE